MDEHRYSSIQQSSKTRAVKRVNLLGKSSHNKLLGKESFIRKELAEKQQHTALSEYVIYSFIILLKEIWHFLRTGSYA